MARLPPLRDGRALLPLPQRERWELLPPPVAQAVLSVLYAALDRRPPFESVERSPFDVALDALSPPPGMTRERLRRGVFEELNRLPWSAGLEPPDGSSWLTHTLISTDVDRTLILPPASYGLTRKVAKAVTDQMRADGTLEAEVGIELGGGLEIYQGRSGLVRVSHSAWVVYRGMPFVQSQLGVYYLDRPPSVVWLHHVFLSPDLGEMHSDEEAERAIRQVWQHGDVLYRALVEALRDAP